MPIIPMTINGGTHPTGDYSHSWGKFTYGYTNKANFATGPGGLTWVSSLDATAFAPTGYFVVSDTVTEDGALGDPVPTFHVTGGTDQQILYLIQRVKSIREVNTNFPNVVEAKKFVVSQAGLNHFDADLTNYRYWNQGTLKLNFDFGNLNCDVKEANASQIYNLVVPSDAVIGETFEAFGSIDSNFASANKASHFRRFATNSTYFSLQGINLSALNSNTGDSFLFAIRMRPTFPVSGSLKILQTVGNISFEADSSAGYKVLVSGIPSATVGIPLGANNTWTTIIFGKDNSGTMFISDGTNSATASAPGAQITFDSGFQAGNLSTVGGGVSIGSLQYWMGVDDSLDVDAITTVEEQQTLDRWV